MITSWIVGTGNIGKGIAKRAKGFDVEIIAYDVFPDEEFAKEYDAEYAPLEELHIETDMISLHVPLTEETKGKWSSKKTENL